jgi:C-methyltransferase
MSSREEDFRSQKISSPDAIWDLNYSFYKVTIIKAGIELRVWEKVASGLRTASSISDEGGWDPIGTRMLLDALCGMGLMTKDEKGYLLTPVAEIYLLPSKSTYIGNAVLADLAWQGRGQISDAVRLGRRPIMNNFALEQTFPWAGFYAGRRVEPGSNLDTIDKMWDAVGIKPREGLRVLDVACGTGIKSMALARLQPGVRITLLDRPEMLEVAKEIAEKLRVTGQVSLIPGDLQDLGYGQDEYDVVWFGNVTHFFGPNDVTRIFHKAFRGLVSGGTIVVNAPIADEARCENENALVAAMEMFVFTPNGDEYTLSEYRSFLENAGFVKAEQVREDLVKAVKP